MSSSMPEFALKDFAESAINHGDLPGPAIWIRDPQGRAMPVTEFHITTDGDLVIVALPTTN